VKGEYDRRVLREMGGFIVERKNFGGRIGRAGGFSVGYWLI
jgi:hypothetical protein